MLNRMIVNLLEQVQDLKEENRSLRTQTKVLVTGGTGYLGQFLLEHFTQAEGFSVAYTHTAAAPLDGVKAVHYQLDFSKPGQLLQVFGNFNPHVIIHCAAMSSPGQCEKDPALAMEINAPTEFISGLQAVSRQVPELTSGPLVIFLSTDQVFDGKSPPYREEDAPNPLNAYARSKFEMEKLLLDGWAQGPKVILRSSNIIGGDAPLAPIKGTKFTQWLKGMLADASAGSIPVSEYKPATLFEDERRSYVYVRDIVSTVFNIVEIFRAAKYAGQGSLPTVVHMGGPESLTRVDMGEAVIAAIGSSLTLLVRDGDKAEEKPKIQPTLRATMDLGYASPLDISMDSSLLSRELGVQMKTMQAALSEALTGK
jgi:dTDP-4-dehydrorhamnose reductase